MDNEPALPKQRSPKIIRSLVQAAGKLMPSFEPGQSRTPERPSAVVRKIEIDDGDDCVSGTVETFGKGVNARLESIYMVDDDQVNILTRPEQHGGTYKEVTSHTVIYARRGAIFTQTVLELKPHGSDGVAFHAYDPRNFKPHTEMQADIGMMKGVPANTTLTSLRFSHQLNDKESALPSVGDEMTQRIEFVLHAASGLDRVA